MINKFENEKDDMEYALQQIRDLFRCITKIEDNILVLKTRLGTLENKEELPIG